MKFDFLPDPARVAKGLRWRDALPEGRRVVLMASTRDGEEPLLLAAWRHRVGRANAPLLVLVPRHPHRFESVAALVRTAEFRIARRSECGDGLPDLEGVDVWLGDSLGELAAYYAMCDVAIIGGSFLPLGGQNLIEAAAAGKPSVMGPSTFNFSEAAQLAAEAGAMLPAENTDEAVANAMALIHDDQQRARIAVAAKEFARFHAGATDKTLALFSEMVVDVATKV
jgi:3-deoxy-D-manno-octulosonic-acid transferase